MNTIVLEGEVDFDLKLVWEKSKENGSGLILNLTVPRLGKVEL